MSGALEIAAIGLRAQQRALETIAGNISNVNTPGFKRSDLRFSELVAAVPISQDTGTRTPGNADAAISGVGAWSRPLVDQQGKLEATGNPFDLAIDGTGFVELMGAAGRSLLWRGGALKVLEDGSLATASGAVLKAGITVPAEATGIRIDRSGAVRAIFAADREEAEIGRIDLVKLVDDAAIERMDGGIYAATGDADLVEAPAGEEGLGYFVQGSVERSNVDLNEEMVGLLVSQRAYAANAQVIRAIDEFLSLANNLRR